MSKKIKIFLFFWFIYSFDPSILYMIYESFKVRGLDLRNHFNYDNLKKKSIYASMGNNSKINLFFFKYGKKLKN